MATIIPTRHAPAGPSWGVPPESQDLFISFVCSKINSITTNTRVELDNKTTDAALTVDLSMRFKSQLSIVKNTKINSSNTTSN